MDGMTLLTQAQAAGLTVEAYGDRLVLRGPKSAEELAQRLLRNKTEVMAALDNAPTVDGPESPAASEESITKVREEMAGKASEMVTVAKMSEMETPATDSTLVASGFADWIRRPDATGRMGWESPGLPDSARWWARSTFEELPEPPPPCPHCGSLKLWETPAGAWRCLRCHPPTAASRLLEQAAAIRRRESKPDPPGAAEMSADLKRLATVG